MKTYFRYEDIIKSKEAAEAIASPIGLGPFCGFGSATVTGNKIRVIPGDNDINHVQSNIIKDLLTARKVYKVDENIINFGCISRDGYIYVDSSEFLELEVQGTQAITDEVLVFAVHTPIEDPVDNPVTFVAYWNEGSSLYDLYKQSQNPYYPLKPTQRVFDVEKDDPYFNGSLNYTYLDNLAKQRCTAYNQSYNSMVLIGIYGRGSDAITITEESFSIVPYNGKFPQSLDYNTAVHGMYKALLSNLLDKVSDIPQEQTVKDYVDEQLSNIQLNAASSALPIGAIIMWSGISLPSDEWAYCDGREGRPNLSGRFIVGQDPSQEDYARVGNTGGSNEVILATDNLPSHTHEIDDYYLAEDKIWSGADGEVRLDRKVAGSHDTDTDNIYAHYLTHDSKSTGGNVAHENRPPFYVLAYIIKIK